MLTKFWEKWIAQEWKWMKVGTEKLKVDFMGSIDLRCWLWSRSNIQKWRTNQKWWKIIKITRKKYGEWNISRNGIYAHISKCSLTFAQSFAKLSRNFRENAPIRRPQPSAGGASKEPQTPGALVFGSRKASLLEGLAAALGLVSWDFRKLGSTSGRYKDVLQDHGIWLWRSLTFGSLAATYDGKGKCAVPFSCRTPGPRAAGGGSTEQAVMYTMILIHNIRLSRNFRE